MDFVRKLNIGEPVTVFSSERKPYKTRDYQVRKFEVALDEIQMAITFFHTVTFFLLYLRPWKRLNFETGKILKGGR